MTVSHFWLPNGGLQLRVGWIMVARGSLCNRALVRGALAKVPLDTACQLLADTEIDDCITLQAPPWGSAVEGGVDKGGLGFAQKSCSRLDLPHTRLTARRIGRGS